MGAFEVALLTRATADDLLASVAFTWLSAEGDAFALLAGAAVAVGTATTTGSTDFDLSPLLPFAFAAGFVAFDGADDPLESCDLDAPVVEALTPDAGLE